MGSFGGPGFSRFLSRLNSDNSLEKEAPAGRDLPKRRRFLDPHMGGCQHDGPFLVPNIMRHIVFRGPTKGP